MNFLTERFLHFTWYIVKKDLKNSMNKYGSDNMSLLK